MTLRTSKWLGTGEEGSGGRGEVGVKAGRDRARPTRWERLEQWSELADTPPAPGAAVPAGARPRPAGAAYGMWGKWKPRRQASGPTVPLKVDLG